VPESKARSQAEAHQDAVGGVVRVSDVWTLEASEEEVERIRELLKMGDGDSWWARIVALQAESDDESQPMTFGLTHRIDADI